MGFTLGNPKVCTVSDYRGQTYTNQMNAVLGVKPQLMMIVIPNNKSDLYSITKKLCCVQSPCPTQVMTGSLLKKGKGLGSIALKVAIQMACKLGAEPWIVKLPNIAGLMIIGKCGTSRIFYQNDFACYQILAIIFIISQTVIFDIFGNFFLHFKIQTRIQIFCIAREYILPLFF